MASTEMSWESNVEPRFALDAAEQFGEHLPEGADSIIAAGTMWKDGREGIVILVKPDYDPQRLGEIIADKFPDFSVDVQVVAGVEPLGA